MTVKLLPTFLACPQAPWAYENDALNPDRESMVDKLAGLLKKKGGFGMWCGHGVSLKLKKSSIQIISIAMSL